VRAARAGLDNLVMPDERVLLKQAAQQRVHSSPGRAAAAGHAEAAAIEWRAGELEWEAWMRVLDQAVRARTREHTVCVQGVRTGHVYRCASMRPMQTQSSLQSSGMSTSRHSDIEVPPTASGAGRGLCW
jgi:hypothetical protein